MTDTPKAGDLSTTLATWLYYLDQAGQRAKDPGIASALEQISALSQLQAEMLAAADRQDYARAAAIQTQLADSGLAVKPDFIVYSFPKVFIVFFSCL